uniref:Uncharacterized protein n=1 Tax=Arundo donax TaxID=35708 RepID=A0A0A8YPL6_ARUDO
MILLKCSLMVPQLLEFLSVLLLDVCTLKNPSGHFISNTSNKYLIAT